MSNNSKFRYRVLAIRSTSIVNNLAMHASLSRGALIYNDACAHDLNTSSGQ